MMLDGEMSLRVFFLAIGIVLSTQTVAQAGQSTVIEISDGPSQVEEYVYERPYEMALGCADSEKDGNSEYLTITFMNSGEIIVFIQPYMLSTKRDINYPEILGFQGATTHLTVAPSDDFLVLEGFLQPTDKTSVNIVTLKITLDIKDEIGFVRKLTTLTDGRILKSTKTLKCSVPLELAEAVYNKYGS